MNRIRGALTTGDAAPAPAAPGTLRFGVKGGGDAAEPFAEEAPSHLWPSFAVKPPHLTGALLAQHLVRHVALETAEQG